MGDGHHLAGSGKSGIQMRTEYNCIGQYNTIQFNKWSNENSENLLNQNSVVVAKTDSCLFVCCCVALSCLNDILSIEQLLLYSSGFGPLDESVCH